MFVIIDDNINDFEMLILTFMKVNNDNEINIAKSFYKNKNFTFRY